MRSVAAFFAVLLSASSAHAYLKAGPAGYGHWLQATAVQQGMTTSLAAAYSFRKVRDAYAGSAVKLRRTTGGTLDIGFTAGGDFDTAAAATFCAATTCFLDTWYDQSTNARHATQATVANQPAYQADCDGGKPCMISTIAAAGLTGPSVTPAGSQSFSAVGRSASAESCTFAQAGSNFIASNSSGSWWLLFNGASPVIVTTAAHGVWHSGQGTLLASGFTSPLEVDGTIVTNDVGPTLTAGTVRVALGGTSGAIQCSIREAFYWNGYALTAGERTALSENQRNYYMPLPLDTFAQPAAAYSMRRLKSSYTGPAIRLRRASDNAETDIGFLGFTSFTGAPIDTAAANAHCATTTCAVTTWYDQSGNGKNSIQETLASQHGIAFGCALNGLPCVRAVSAAQYFYTAAPHAAPVLPVTFSAVANRSSGTGVCLWPQQFLAGNALGTGGPNLWALAGGGSGYITVAAADNAWHAGSGVINGASSVARADATEVAGSATGSVAADALVALWGADATTCNAAEVIVWGGYALTAGERTALQTNQKNFWGTP